MGHFTMSEYFFGLPLPGSNELNNQGVPAKSSSTPFSNQGAVSLTRFNLLLHSIS
jgi:hypothetical protein